jgi:tRNA(His) 5'-end guanylyltransferase
MFQFANKQLASERLNLSCSTLKKYRLNGTLIEGTHWVKVNCRCILYNLELIQDWLHNRHDPIAHHRAIDIYHASLVSNQKRSKRKALLPSESVASVPNIPVASGISLDK